MKPDRLLRFGALAWVLAVSAPSWAQPLHDDNPYCRSFAAFGKHIGAYNEFAAWRGSNAGKTYEVFSSIDGLSANGVTERNATWTADYVAGDGRKCLVATGVEWIDTPSSGLRVRKLGSPRNGGGAAKDEARESRNDGLSEYVIGTSRLRLVGSCNNGYSLDAVVAANPYVIARGTVKEASDRVNAYSLSVHHPDYLYILSSAPAGAGTREPTWAILLPLPIMNGDARAGGCTYIEAVGTHGRILPPPLSSHVGKKARI